MRIRCQTGVVATVSCSGDLELLVTSTGLRYRCSPMVTAIWIMLQQNDGQLDMTQAALADVWCTDFGTIRRSLDEALAPLIEEDLLVCHPC